MSVALGCAVGAPMWGSIYDFFGSYKPAVAVFPIIELIDLVIIVFLMVRYHATDWEK